MESNERPQQTIRRGAIAASVWRRQGREGESYYEFTLSRSWKRGDDGESGYSQSFRETNEADLRHVIDLACRWIREKSDARELPAAIVA